MSCCGSSPSRATGSAWCPPRRRSASSGRRPGPPCPASRSPTTSGPTCTRSHTSGSASGPTWWWSPRPRPICSRRRPTASPTTCSPTSCSPPGARCCSPPAMHTEMWEHPATVANVATLRSRGVRVVEPAVGRLTGADTGKGRLPDPAEIFAVVRRALARGPHAPADLAGRHVVVTAGGTREPLDPVRFLGNRSSGKQGYAFARSAVARGARVTLIAANVALADPAGVDLVRVSTTEELREATVQAAAEADAVVMAAAPADFRPATYAPAKIKKSDARPPTIELVTNPDIAAELGRHRRPEQVLVVFAAETGDAEANGRAKLAHKRADLIVINEVGPDKVFGAETNAATVIGADGSMRTLPEQSKEDLADGVWDLVVARWASRPEG
ncbi:phosphopantothenoylcysteine decarboxylase [Micromonospora sp. ATCC 39149]|nr:phosphopantothenoylcysteine decarboxylase [Micromonospora sp. ATCC 39149]